ncbi:MAG: anthranilate phosphoribosyltransferase [Candidatus Dormiibacterota bacterium]
MGEEVMRQALEAVVSSRALDTPMARAVMDTIMDGEATPAQVGALVAALRTKGETVDELEGMVESMRAHATVVTLSVDAVDTCGTGGDGAGTFNISTAAALVTAGAGCPVAKHGNRAASSRCGSADVFEALGVVISLSPDGVRRCVEEAGIGFLYAPDFHPALRHVIPVRRELGIRTVFNVLGPLANPARVRHQLIGVSNARLAPLMAEVLHRLGHVHAIVFTGPDGIDELGVDGTARCFEVTPDGVREFVIDPADTGLEVASLDAVRGGDAETNAAIIVDVLEGAQGPRRDVVLLNSAAVLLAADRVSSLREGITVAASAIDSGDARRALAHLARVSHEAAA